jgi:hypothetical protein
MRDALAGEFLGGRAAVAPKDLRRTCRRCAVQPFCRMAELFADRMADDQEGGDD